MRTLDDLGDDLDNRRPEEDGVGVVGWVERPEGEDGLRETASENLLVTAAASLAEEEEESSLVLGT